jgi:hypothetical protein
MIHDEDLKTCLDDSEGQKQAAHRVLIELVHLFYDYSCVDWKYNKVYNMK